MIKKQLLLVIFSILISCTGGSKTSENSDSFVENDNQLLIHIFMEDILQKEDTELLSSIASEIFYIPLETNNNSLLKGLSRNIAYLNEHYVVNDTENLFLFDKDGKFIKRVTQRGGGPADYTSLNNIIPDQGTNYFYLFTSRKVIKFDEKANYIQNFSIDDSRKVGGLFVGGTYSHGLFTPDKTMILGLHNMSVQHEDTATIYNALEIDTLGNIINKFTNRSPRYVNMTAGQITSSITSLYLFNNDIKFLDFGNDTIFSIVRGSMTPYAILDLGKNKTNFILNLSANDDFGKGRELINSSIGHRITNVFENKIYLFITLTKKGLAGDDIYCLYNKKTKELKLLKDDVLINDIDGGASFFPRKSINDNELIGWRSAEGLKKEILSKDYNEQKAKYGERFEKAYQLAKSLKDDDNPVLMIARK